MATFPVALIEPCILDRQAANTAYAESAGNPWIRMMESPKAHMDVPAEPPMGPATMILP